MELDMKKDIDSKDIISEGTLHEILLDIKYRLDHLEDMEADNRALMVKLVKQSNSIVQFLSQIDLEADEHIMMEDMGKLPPIENKIYDSEKTKKLKKMIDEFLEKKEELKEFEEELKENKEMLTPGQTGEA
tara:strand:+ start:1816 stop:2208 length:393 start_codon:yes stop_codon:yes gene_type:complete